MKPPLTPEEVREKLEKLRDNFAIAALSNPFIIEAAFGIEREARPPDYVARYCYEFADAMLEARAEKYG